MQFVSAQPHRPVLRLSWFDELISGTLKIEVGMNEQIKKLFDLFVMSSQLNLFTFSDHTVAEMPIRRAIWIYS